VQWNKRCSVVSCRPALSHILCMMGCPRCAS
jgi:hypothetical protein